MYEYTLMIGPRVYLSPATELSVLLPGCFQASTLSFVLCGMPLLPVITLLSPWAPNIHLTMFTENCFVHRHFQARALHRPHVALVCVRCHRARDNPSVTVVCDGFTCKIISYFPQ